MNFVYLLFVFSQEFFEQEHSEVIADAADEINKLDSPPGGCQEDAASLYPHHSVLPVSQNTVVSDTCSRATGEAVSADDSYESVEKSCDSLNDSDGSRSSLSLDKTAQKHPGELNRLQDHQQVRTEGQRRSERSAVLLDNKPHKPLKSQMCYETFQRLCVLVPPLQAVEGVTAKLFPDTSWSQTDGCVYVNIHLVGVEIYRCRLGTSRLTFL